MSEQNEQPNARWTREQLNAYAARQGVDFNMYATKEDLIDALIPDGEDDEMPEADEMPADGDEQPQDEPDEGALGGDTAERYYVDKAFTLADGQVVMPGTEWSPDADFPKRRPQQLVEQKFLRPID